MLIKAFDKQIWKLFAPDLALESVLTGFQFLEGPLWNPADQSLIFSDILGNTLYRWSQSSGTTILRRNSYMANGNACDLQGRVVTCEHATSRVTRTDFSSGEKLEVLATHYQGKQLNSPNDIVCKRDGFLYFTDPNSGRGENYGVPRPQELEFQGVYRLNPLDLSLTLLVDDFSKPNGLCFSSDEQRLFINDSAFGHIRVFDVKADGSLSGGEIWAELQQLGTGVADGMKIDRQDNLFCTGPGGVHVFDANANYLGVLTIPEQAANLAWGGPDLDMLYITATSSIYRLQTCTVGLPSNTT